MISLPRPGGEQRPPTPEEFQAAVGKRLDDVAKVLAGALVTVAGVMTALGLTSDIVFVALNNESWPIYVASLCAIVAIVCSIVALLIRPTPRGNLWETIVLILGVVFYMVALSVAVVGASQAAGGNGRPTITDVRLDGPRSDLRLSFEVHADGVDTWATIEVYASAVDRNGDALSNVDFYSSVLRPDDRGDVSQRISTPATLPAKAWGIQISALAADGPEECEKLTQHGPACVEVQVP
ncbi:hypothetical protein LRS74_20680 [Streptomyces sp. LX-29]|uniref:hypothetical protein n=1 Tax=Streptomyces sp. LX-29 TaxID=2900152 RepID=UPI00240D70FD|nr:hypothetical protein [Streptomyces sp. LX-29]WFB09182.1 hypothetical protein LRS74_20680 [Streptomyces sp. LX-29]